MNHKDILKIAIMHFIKSCNPPSPQDAIIFPQQLGYIFISLFQQFLIVNFIPVCRYVLADAEERFSFYDKDSDGFITADEHKNAMFGAVEGKI